MSLYQLRNDISSIQFRIQLAKTRNLREHLIPLKFQLHKAKEMLNECLIDRIGYVDIRPVQDYEVMTDKFFEEVNKL